MAPSLATRTSTTRTSTTLPAYGGDAHTYDARTTAFAYWRRRLVELVPADPGATVVDIGCGTGLCLDALRERVGPRGTVIGVDASADMLELAAERVAQEGWENVRLVRTSAEDFELPALADHVVFCAVHDVMQSEVALANAMRQVRPGGTVVAGGGKWAPDYAFALNVVIRATHAPFVGDFAGFDRPWARLADHVEDLEVREVAMGGGYLATGRVPRREPDPGQDARGSSPS
jgi:demethylmenaquinone methyltransferase/2-methoxy-6-polyprenyl-1,4-benzoquinol methylase